MTPARRRRLGARSRRARVWIGATVALAGSVGVAGAVDAPATAAVDAIPIALPGAEGLPKSLREQLARALARRGPDYTPRTRHVRADGSPVYTNRLLLESSPYLLQHAHNPVNWYPWGDEAFDTARRLGRPVLVSIGYSTCHWCHVMEEESFDTPEIAEDLNRHFIAVKVDRETRPDVDAIYMSALHAMNQQGGWPLNVFVTPDRKPFFGGTYFPPEDARTTRVSARAAVHPPAVPGEPGAGGGLGDESREGRARAPRGKRRRDVRCAQGGGAERGPPQRGRALRRNLRRAAGGAEVSIVDAPAISAPLRPTQR